MSRLDRPGPDESFDPETLSEALKDRYPTLFEAAADVAKDEAKSVVAGWVLHAREVLDAYAAEQKSRRRVSDAMAVKESYELAAALVAAIANKGGSPTDSPRD